MFITGTWQRGARCFLIAITDPPGFCSACTLPTAQGQGQKDQLFFWSPYPIVRPSVQLYSLDLINSELFRWGGPLPCRLLFFSAAKGGGALVEKTCESGALVARAWTERKKMFLGGSFLKLADDNKYIKNPEAQNREFRGFWENRVWKFYIIGIKGYFYFILFSKKIHQETFFLSQSMLLLHVICNIKHETAALQLTSAQGKLFCPKILNW